jgi:membrane-bound serine protease (ClpP class)
MARPQARRPDNPAWLRYARRLVSAALLIAATALTFAQGNTRVVVSDISGAIGVASVRQLSLAMDRARAEQAEALIVRLDTPGGLVTSTRDLIKQFAGSDRRLCRANRRARGVRRHLSGLRLAHRSHGARDQSRRGHAGRDRRGAGAAAAAP